MPKSVCILSDGESLNFDVRVTQFFIWDVAHRDFALRTVTTPVLPALHKGSLYSVAYGCYKSGYEILGILNCMLAAISRI